MTPEDHRALPLCELFLELLVLWGVRETEYHFLWGEAVEHEPRGILNA